MPAILLVVLFEPTAVLPSVFCAPPKPAAHTLQHEGAADPLADALQFGIFGHRTVLPASVGTAGAFGLAVRLPLIPSRSGDREAGGVQGRRLRRRLRSGFPCSPHGASGSGSPALLSFHSRRIAEDFANSSLGVG